MGMIQDLQKMDKERRAEVKQLQREVATMLKDFAKGDVERASEVATMAIEADALVQDFTEGSAQRRSEVKTMVNDLARGDAERASEVATMRAETDAMVDDLTKGSARRRSEVKTMVNDLAKADAERASEVATMNSEFAKADAERASEVATMRAETDAMVKDLTRGSAQRHIEIWGGVAPAKVKAAPPKPVPPVAELPKETPAGELRDRTFAYLADHPDGTRLVELEEEFGVSRIEMAKVIRGLIDDNKVEKRDLLYFAI